MKNGLSPNIHILTPCVNNPGARRVQEPEYTARAALLLGKKIKLMVNLGQIGGRPFYALLTHKSKPETRSIILSSI